MKSVIVRIIEAAQRRLAIISRALGPEVEPAADNTPAHNSTPPAWATMRSVDGGNSWAAIRQRGDAVWGSAQATVTPGPPDSAALDRAQAVQEALDNAIEVVLFAVNSMPAEATARWPFQRLRRLASQLRALNHPLLAEGVHRRLMEFAGEAEACENIRAERAEKQVVRPATAEDWAANGEAFKKEFGMSPAEMMHGAKTTPPPGAKDPHSL